MDIREQESPQDFIKKLANAAGEEIKKYLDEIETNRSFHDLLGENRGSPGGRRYRTRDYGIGPELGAVLYALCRLLKPDVAIETGVASGVSSSYILGALETAGHGELYSIDLPHGPPQAGWLIPDYLRHRWHLVTGNSSEKLGPLLKEVGQIDIFLHDSDHSYQSMLHELQTAWASLKAGGLLLAHNVDMSDAFPDFCRDAGVTGHRLADLGGIVKK
jgi:predicted O-methyltransferase YrrM